MEEPKPSVPTRVLSGFMELLPAEQLVFDRMKNTIQEVYERFGFVPLDTPVIEREEVLILKAGGETEKQIYQFAKGDTKLALRFDLTVPLARYVAEHNRDLSFPFRRCHIGKVYRGENPQKGRFREFYQCDIDVIGNEVLSGMYDAEIISVIAAVFDALAIGKYVIRINNRKLLNGLMESLDLQNRSAEILRIIDKLEKVGESEVRKMLGDLGVSEQSANTLFEFLSITGNPGEVLAALSLLDVSNPTYRTGIEELSNLMEGVQKMGVSSEVYRIDLSIARGLDYYTGNVYETQLADHPEFGTVCAGGRYENLTSSYSGKQYPGVGATIGLTRLFSQLLAAGEITPEAQSPAKVLVLPLVEDLSFPLEIASILRKNGISTNVYLESASMKAKFNYANKSGIPFALIIGEDEEAAQECTLKNMETGEQERLPIEAILERIGK